MKKMLKRMHRKRKRKMMIRRTLMRKMKLMKIQGMMMIPIQMVGF